MSTDFTNTIRSLTCEQSSRKVSSFVLVLVGIAVWALWCLKATVAVYEVSDSARLEATQQARPVVSLIDGRIKDSQLKLGQRVRAGDPLITLDDQIPRLAREEGRARIADIENRIGCMTGEIVAERNAIESVNMANQVALQECQAKFHAFEAQVAYTMARLERSQQLARQQAIARDELQRLEAEAKADQAALRALRAAVNQRECQNQVDRNDRLVRISKLESQRTELQGKLRIQQSLMQRLDEDIDQCIVRAPISGMIGRLAESPVGSVVKRGAAIAHVVPVSEHRAVALFPVTASGRIQAGQKARLRMDGFSWTQYGHIDATVINVASEPDSRQIRVEFDLDETKARIPIQHGLPGVAEVSVENVPPWLLLVRRIGGVFHGDHSTSTIRLAQSSE